MGRCLGKRGVRARGRVRPPVIRECPNGFSVTVARCRPLHVSSRAAYLELEAGSDNAKRFGFYESRRLVDTICDWVNLSGKRSAAGDVRRLLAQPVREQCDRLLRAADPTIAAVHYSISRVTGASPTIAMCPGLYRHCYLVSDIIKFRAAAIVAANFDRLQPRYLDTLVKESPECHALTARAEACGADVTVHVEPRPAPQARSVSEQALVHLHAWRRARIVPPHRTRAERLRTPRSERTVRNLMNYCLGYDYPDSFDRAVRVGSFNPLTALWRNATRIIDSSRFTATTPSRKSPASLVSTETPCACGSNAASRPLTGSGPCWFTAST